MKNFKKDQDYREDLLILINIKEDLLDLLKHLCLCDYLLDLAEKIEEVTERLKETQTDITILKYYVDLANEDKDVLTFTKDDRRLQASLDLD